MEMTGNDNNGQTNVTHKGLTCSVDEKTGNEADTWISLRGGPHHIAAGK